MALKTKPEPAKDTIKPSVGSRGGATVRESGSQEHDCDAAPGDNLGFDA